MKFAAAGGATLCSLPMGCSSEAANGAPISDHEALAYEKLSGKAVRCVLCPRECIVRPGQRGYCEVRENQNGVYKTLVYGRVCSAHVDPIEKKPLFHFLPGTRALSVATAGCNVECQFCQNWEISQRRPEEIESDYLPPKETVEAAHRTASETVAFTYSEPTVFYEYMLDTARACRKAGIHSVSITNGYIQPEPMRRLCKELSAVKVDLKGFTEKFYRDYVYGELKPVLATIELLKELGMHTELVTLLVPGLNDGEDEIKQLSRWVVKTLGPDVPMHFSRFHPNYKMTNLAQTPRRTVVRARDIAMSEGVHYAYVGNLPSHEYENTFCHKCGRKIIERYGYHVGKVRITRGKCDYCRTAIPGVWEG
jgi:pyruvate formate lyase activating enzyme